MKHVNVDDESVVIFNPLSFERQDYISFSYDEAVTVYDGDMPLPTTYADGQVTFYGTVPAKGYKTFALKGEEKAVDSDLVATTDHLENAFFDIRLDDKGHIVSLMDKRVNRQVLKKGERANVLQAFEDKPHNWDAWDINIYYQEKMWEIDDVQKIEVVEHNALKATLVIERKFLDSTLTQYMTIYKESARIDFDTTIDWKEKHILVKAAFPVDIHTSKAIYDIQFGNVERPTHWNTSWDTAKFEVCGHKWADLSEDGYGVSLMNDCKYGYDIKDSQMRLTLLKSATEPNEDADREVHHFTYALYPHIGDFKTGNTVSEAYKLNVPVYTVVAKKNTGELPRSLSFVEVNQDNVIAEVVKQNETSEDMIIRVHECYNRRTDVTMSVFGEIAEVIECDLEERKVLDDQVVFDGGNVQFQIKPFEIKTFKIKLK